MPAKLAEQQAFQVWEFGVFERLLLTILVFEGEQLELALDPPLLKQAESMLVAGPLPLSQAGSEHQGSQT